jgi:hypothetical protein
MRRTWEVSAALAIAALIGGSVLAVAEDTQTTQTQATQQATQTTQTEATVGPRFVDNDGDGICDRCGRNPNQVARRNRPGRGSGNGGVGPRDGSGNGPGPGTNCDGTGPKGRGRRGGRR